MRPDISEDAGRRRVWQRAILPLLDEYFYNQRNRAELLDEFSLDRLLGDAPFPALTDDADS